MPSSKRRPPRVLLAPNAFKETHSAAEVAEAWARALSEDGLARPDPRPLSDGGDGFVAVVRRYRPRVLEAAFRVPDPLGRAVSAAWGWDPGRRAAYVESAAAIGVRLVGPAERRPLEADTAGLGRLLRSAAGLGVRRFTIGLGGSATVDGGLGMARAMGFRFERARGGAIERPADLERLARIVPPRTLPLPPRAPVTTLADVRNPLLGPSGAAAVFGPQKGADPAAVRRLEAGLAAMAERWAADLGAEDDLARRAGAGAAGGLGAAMVAFLGARLSFGAPWCARLAGFGAALERADLVLTGEGRFDAGGQPGKVTGYVLGRARRAGVPAAVICGSRGSEGPAPVPSVAAGGPLVLDAAALGSHAGGDLDLDELADLARLAVTSLRDGGIPP